MRRQTNLCLMIILLCATCGVAQSKSKHACATLGAAPVTEAELTIREREVGGVIILDLEGKITEAGGTAALRKALRGLLDEGKLNILLNLKGVSGADESGIGELVASYTQTTNKGGQLKLLNLSKAFKDLLMVTKFLTVFQSI